jgi:hypothetical protein
MDTITEPTLSGKWLAGFLYAILSVGLEYWPAFAEWWDDVEMKEVIVASAGLVVTAGLVGLHYLGAFGLEIGPFGWDVVGEALEAWLGMLGGSWSLWNLVRRTGTMYRDQNNEQEPV